MSDDGEGEDAKGELLWNTKLPLPARPRTLPRSRRATTVLLSGVVYTARDQAHRRMIEALEKGEPLPFDLTGSAIYYVGPTPERPGQVIGSAGPHHQRPHGCHEPAPAGPWQ